MVNNNRKIAEFAASMFLSALIFLIIYKFIPIVYSTNDDRMIAEIVSGQFTGKPESYGIQMTYGFTWFLSKLYEMTRSLNWYGIVLIGVQIFSFGTVLYRLQSMKERFCGKVCMVGAAAAVYAALWLKVYVQLTYTTTAAFAGMAAVFWYAASKTNWKNCLMVIFLANIAFCIRPNVFYLFVPATGLVYLWKLIGKKDMQKLTIAAPFMVLAVTAALFLINASAYSKEGWKEFREFFNDRTDVYDYYDLLPYAQYPQLYEPYGISEEEYDMMRIYDYTVLGDLPKEFFPEYLKACEAMKKEEGAGFLNKSADAVKIFIRDVFTNEYGSENTVLFAAAALLLIYLIIKKRYPLAIYLAVQSAAVCAVWLYFTYWGRTIDRIQITMSLIFLSVILHVLAEMMSGEKEEETGRACTEKKKRLIAALAILGITAAAGINLKDLRHENIAKCHRYNDVLKIKEYCAKDPERLYFMDIATMTELYGNCTIKNTEPEYINYICLGDWSAYCPHYEEKLERHGVEDVAASITKENTYVIMLHTYQVQCMKDYLGVEEEWTESIFGSGDQLYAVFQFHER